MIVITPTASLSNTQVAVACTPPAMSGAERVIVGATEKESPASVTVIDVTEPV